MNVKEACMDENEQILILKLKNGEKAVFESIFHNYYCVLLAFTKEYLPDLDVARDIVQETFITLWEKKEILNSDTNLKAYLFTISRNKSLNYLKRRQLENKITNATAARQAEIYLNYYALKDQSAEQIYKAEFEQLIAEGIQSLPEQCRKIFYLSRLQYRKNQEIANQLNISIKTVESHITKSLKILREKLSPYLQMILSVSLHFIN